MKVMLAIPCIELVLAIVATLVPFSAAEIGDKVPMIVIFIVLVLIGEVVRVVSARGRKEEYKGLTPELAAQRLAEEAAGWRRGELEHPVLGLRSSSRANVRFVGLVAPDSGHCAPLRRRAQATGLN